MQAQGHHIRRYAQHTAALGRSLVAVAGVISSAVAVLHAAESAGKYAPLRLLGHQSCSGPSALKHWQVRPASSCLVTAVWYVQGAVRAVRSVWTNSGVPLRAFHVAAAPIYVDIEYTRGREIVTRKGPGQAVRIGRMPLMLRCDRWAAVASQQAAWCAARPLLRMVALTGMQSPWQCFAA